MRKRPKVVLLSGSFFPREGGAERQMKSVLQRLESSGIRTLVLTLPAVGARSYDRVGDVAVRRIGSYALFRKMPRLSSVIYVVVAAVLLAVVQPRAVVSLQMGSASVAGSLGTLSRRSVKRYVRLTGGGTSRFKSEAFARAASWKGRLLVGLVMLRRPVVVAPARHLLSDFKEKFPTYDLEMIKVPNGVSDSSLELLDTKPYRDVVWYARSGAEKSVELFREISSELPTISFTVIGQRVDGVGGNVENRGWVENPEGVIAQHRVLLNTSVQEGMPNTALQALYIGLNVVGFANAGMMELEDEFPSHVHTVQYGDARAMAQELVKAGSISGHTPRSVPGESEVFEIWKGLLK